MFNQKIINTGIIHYIPHNKEQCDIVKQKNKLSHNNHKSWKLQFNKSDNCNKFNGKATNTKKCKYFISSGIYRTSVL